MSSIHLLIRSMWLIDEAEFQENTEAVKLRVLGKTTVKLCQGLQDKCVVSSTFICFLVCYQNSICSLNIMCIICTLKHSLYLLKNLTIFISNFKDFQKINACYTKFKISSKNAIRGEKVK